MIYIDREANFDKKRIFFYEKDNFSEEPREDSTHYRNSKYNLKMSSEFMLNLAEFAQKLRIDDLSQEVIEHSRYIVLDTVGTMLAGASLTEIKALSEMSNSLGGPGGATLMGCQQTSSPYFASFVNGTGAVSLELDEGNQYAINHPSVHILPAALALAEENKQSGAEFLSAFIAGYEISVRIGLATHLREAVHPFGTYTIVGTAAAASKLLKFDKDHMVQALNLAAGMCIASSQKAANAGASVRNLATGLTNYNGLIAPFLVRAGFTGDPKSFSTIFGGILGDSFREDKLEEDLGRTFYITRNYFKPYACSRWNHAPIEAIASMYSKRPFDPKDVEEITVWTYDPATRLSCNDPPNGYAAKHSIPYNVAARLVLGTNDIDAYSDDVLLNPHIQNIARRVKVREDPKMTSKLPDVRPARVEVKLCTGDTLDESIDRPRGGFDNPLSKDELLEKFHRLAGMTLPRASVSELVTKLATLDELEDITLLSPLMQRTKL